MMERGQKEQKRTGMEKHVFWLGCGCLMALGTLAVAEIVLGKDLLAGSQLLSQVVSLLKYVAVTSLGFFLASCGK